MSGAFVTLDLGNSRLKLRSWSHPAAIQPSMDARRDLALDTTLLDGLADAFDSIGDVERVALSAVGSRELETRIVTWLRSRLGDRFRDGISPGIELHVREPARVGRDRVFAARGAFELLHADAIVVDAGTCVTVDALRVDAEHGPCFLGGAIAPGPRLLSEALARGGARLFEVAVDARARALGRDTAEALRAGIVFGLRGAVRELVRAVGEEAGLQGACVVFTGGAAGLLAPAELLADRTTRSVPELVHLGLLAALREDLRDAR